MRGTDTDQGKRYFRSSERVFRMNEAWYFAAREGDQGPFRSESEAHAEKKRFCCDKTELAGFQESREVARTKVAELELVPLDSRPRLRPPTVEAVNRRVMI